MERTDLARRTPQSHAKRQREQAKKEKRRAKEEKKALRKAQKAGIDVEADEAQPEGQINEEEHGAEEEQPLQQPGPVG
jgi:hypothetical protein